MSKEYLEETAAVQEQEGQALTEEQLDEVSGGTAIVSGLPPLVGGRFYCITHNNFGVMNRTFIGLFGKKSACQCSATVNRDLPCEYTEWNWQKRLGIFASEESKDADVPNWQAECRAEHKARYGGIS